MSMAGRQPGFPVGAASLCVARRCAALRCGLMWAVCVCRDLGGPKAYGPAGTIVLVVPALDGYRGTPVDGFFSAHSPIKPGPEFEFHIHTCTRALLCVESRGESSGTG